MGLPNTSRSLLLGAAGQAGADTGYVIERSLRFNSADSAYLSRTPGSAGNRKTFTVSCWVKRSVLGTTQYIWEGGSPDGTTTRLALRFNSSDNINILNLGVLRTTTQVFRDPSAWYHIVVAIDTTQATGADRIKLYVNGSQITSFSSSSDPTQNADTGWNMAASHSIGYTHIDSGNYGNFYLADFHNIDGQALDPTSFGEFDENGIWQPIAYSGSYGTNGFHLDFADNSTAAALGTDTSGNGNTWTVNNITAAEYRVIDAPTLLNGAMIVRGASGGSVSVTISGTGNKNYFTSSDGINWTWQSAATSATYTANYVASGGAGTSTRIAVSNGAFQYAMWNTNTNFDSSSNTTTDTTGLTFTTATANGSNGDSLVDVPTNGTETDTGAGGEVRGNYATLNPLDQTLTQTGSITNGNLDYAASSSGSKAGRATVGITSGKWYWEITHGGGNGSYGVASSLYKVSDVLGTSAYGWGYVASGNKFNSGETSYAASFTTGDVIGVALDLDAGSLTFYKNNVSQGVAFTGISGTIFPVFGTSSVSTVSFTANFGQRPFAYTAPSGFKALCTANLGDPVVTKPSEYMDVVTYTDNGGTQTISGLEFSPDLVWIKQRSGTNSHILKTIFQTKFLSSNGTEADRGNDGDLITSLDANGFTVNSTYLGAANASTNGSSQTYVAWTWDVGSSTVSNTDGSITSSVRANPSAGFSIVGWTGDGGAANIGHGLGVEPHLIIHKFRGGTSNWSVYTKTTGAGGRLILNSTAAFSSDGAFPTTPTSSLFYIGSGFNDNGVDMISYCFAPVDGYSSFGSYTGNGSADGPFVYTGFSPAFFMVKASSSTSNWIIFDKERPGYNPEQDTLCPNLSNGEDASGGTTNDFLSNGFKIRGTTDRNSSGVTYIYAAFAESPFQYARAR